MICLLSRMFYWFPKLAAAILLHQHGFKYDTKRRSLKKIVFQYVCWSLGEVYKPISIKCSFICMKREQRALKSYLYKPSPLFCASGRVTWAFMGGVTCMWPSDGSV